MKNKIVFALAFLLVGIFLFSFVSSAELKLIKASQLKQGDIIIDSNGNEIIVQNITTQQTTTKTIQEIIQEKLSRNPDKNNTIVENSVKISDKQVVLGSGNQKVGIIDAFAVYETPKTSKPSVWFLTIQKVKSILMLN
jgi:hypothetical protein